MEKKIKTPSAEIQTPFIESFKREGEVPKSLAPVGHRVTDDFPFDQIENLPRLKNSSPRSASREVDRVWDRLNCFEFDSLVGDTTVLRLSSSEFQSC